MKTLIRKTINTPTDAVNLFVVTRPQQDTVVSLVRSAAFSYTPGSSYDDVRAAPSAIALRMEGTGVSNLLHGPDLIEIPVGSDVALADDDQVDAWLYAEALNAEFRNRSAWRRGETYLAATWAGVSILCVELVVAGVFHIDGTASTIGLGIAAVFAGSFAFAAWMVGGEVKNVRKRDDTEALRAAGAAQKLTNSEPSTELV
jgi:hypothetical protein